MRIYIYIHIHTVDDKVDDDYGDVDDHVCIQSE